MVTASHSGQRETRGTTTAAQPVEGYGASPDPSWRGLYRAGGVAAFLYVLLGVVVPGLLFMPVGYERGLDGDTLLRFIADNRTWWVVVQTLSLGSPILAIVVFAAIFVALKDVNRGSAAVGALVASTCQVLFVAFYPLTLGVVHLSDQYVTAAGTRRASLAAAAEALVAVLDSYSPLYEGAFAVSILMLSLVMLRGVFPRAVAHLGLATAAAAVVALSLWPIIGMGYFWWWLLFVIWFSGAGWRLYRLGCAGRPAGGRATAADGVPLEGTAPRLTT
jgi:hypothetical protein